MDFTSLCLSTKSTPQNTYSWVGYAESLKMNPSSFSTIHSFLSFSFPGHPRDDFHRIRFPDDIYEEVQLRSSRLQSLHFCTCPPMGHTRRGLVLQRFQWYLWNQNRP